MLRDAARQVYRRLVLRGGRVLGAVLYGDTEGGRWFFDLVERQDDVALLRDGLIFGEAFVDRGSAVAAPGLVLDTRFARCRFLGPGVDYWAAARVANG